MLKKMSSYLIVVALISILSSTSLLFADSVWTGLGSTGNWSEAANWDTNSVPLPTDSVIFEGANVKDSFIDAGFGGTIASLTINDGYAGRIFQERSLAITGDYSQSSGDFISRPDLAFSAGGSFSVSAPGRFYRLTGIGTPEDPLLIYDIYGLQGIECKPDSTFNFKLNNNIDASVTVNWRQGRGFSPIGGSKDTGTFQASLDGNARTISNLYINISDPSETNVGLFGYTYMPIKNLGLINCSVTGPACLGDITGVGVGSLSGYNYGTISNCYNTGAVSSGENNRVGGLVGVNAGTISGCYNIGDISGTVTGGLAGQNYGTGKILNCYNSGNIHVNMPGWTSAGGLVGDSNYGTISGSYNKGNVSAGGYAGGLVVWNCGIITDCYNTGTVSQIASGGNNGFIGGLAGWNQSTISNSYNTGSVSGDHYVGGLVGWLYRGRIYNSYNVGIVSDSHGNSNTNIVQGFVGHGALTGTISNCGWWTGACTWSGANALVYSESDKSVFTNPGHGVYTAGSSVWDFNSIWGIDTGVSYPFLRWQIPAGSWTLNMIEMNWYENTVPYNSTGAAACQMVLNYIREGAGQALLAQNEIYEYGKAPAAYGLEMTPKEVDKALGHFDPYDYLVSNSYDVYDSRPDGNPFQGYNYSIDTYNPASDPDAINKYMRDICHWMAFTVTKEDRRGDGELVARPNTPAVLPIYGSYANWVAVKGYVTSANPAPEPRTNPWYTPDFTVYGFWMKDPRVSGIGQNTYKTAAECQSTYFLPLATSDSYNGLFLQVAEPPAEMSGAVVEIPAPSANLANLDLIGAAPAAKDSGEGSRLIVVSSPGSASKGIGKTLIRKRDWRDLIDRRLLSDPEAAAAFEGTKIDKPVLVHRTDAGGSDYYLVPFNKQVKGKPLTSAVTIIDANKGYFKEASWTDKPGELFSVSEREALRLVRESIMKDYREELKSIAKKPVSNYLFWQMELSGIRNRLLRDLEGANVVLAWEPNGYSPSPYKPYWKIDGSSGHSWCVTQDGKVISL